MVSQDPQLLSGWALTTTQYPIAAMSLGANNNPVSNSSNVTVENMVMVNDSAYDRTLVFSSLHISLGGQYTCQAALDQTSAVASTKLLVQSACVKSMAFHIWCIA